MRLLHTSDWHLGHSLKEVSREFEHRAFLAWLLATLASENPDALLITGDIFDSATPPASAEQMWFGFLAAVRRAHPLLDVIVIAGNHDSPSRLAAPAPVLRELNVTIVAHVPRDQNLQPRWSDLILPMCKGKALVAAVPYLRAHDLAHFSDDENASGRRDISLAYGRVKTAVRAIRTATQPLIVLGHLYAAGGVAAPSSERPIIVGGQDAAPPSMFPKEASYVALGHLHRGQKVISEHIRYAGSPIPLSVEEANNRNHVVAVDIDDETLVATIRLLEVPRAVDIIRIPRQGAASLDVVLMAIAALPDADPQQMHPPFVEVCVELSEPEPKLRSKIETAIASKHVRLINIKRTTSGLGQPLSAGAIRSLEQLQPRDVFIALWRRTYGNDPSDDILQAFGLLHAQATAIAIEESVPSP
jgi:DNA repair protein SbcD/Mre11